MAEDSTPYYSPFESNSTGGDASQQMYNQNNNFGSNQYDEAGGNFGQSDASTYKGGNPDEASFSKGGNGSFGAGTTIDDHAWSFPTNSAANFGMPSQGGGGGSFGGGYQSYGEPGFGVNPLARGQGSLDALNAANRQYAASANATNAPLAYKQGVFDKIFPLVQGLIGGMDGGGGFNVNAAGGVNTPQLALPPSFVYSPSEIQGSVNQARAQGDRGAATQKQTIANQMAGRGFAGTSPIALALQQAADSGARSQNAQTEQGIRFNAAGANAQQADTVGTLGEAQWRDFNDADIRRRMNQANFSLGQNRNTSSLISALGAL